MRASRVTDLIDKADHDRYRSMGPQGLLRETDRGDMLCQGLWDVANNNTKSAIINWTKRNQEYASYLDRAKTKS